MDFVMFTRCSYWRTKWSIKVPCKHRLRNWIAFIASFVSSHIVNDTVKRRQIWYNIEYSNTVIEAEHMPDFEFANGNPLLVPGGGGVMVSVSIGKYSLLRTTLRCSKLILLIYLMFSGIHKSNNEVRIWRGAYNGFHCRWVVQWNLSTMTT